MKPPLPIVRGLCLLLLALTGCKSDGFSEAQVLGGVSIDAETLNRGLAVYRKHCTGCHGKDGEGGVLHDDGAPPRDLRTGYYKFTSVRGDGLPTDDDLLRILKGGLGGTRMPGFDTELSEGDLRAVAHYIKTFAPRWREEGHGEPIPMVDDPWTGDRQAAIRRGFEVYHAEAQCWTCHPAYAERSTILDLSREMDQREGRTPRKSMPWRAEMSSSKGVSTRYGRVLPPDFLSDRVPAAKGLEGLYRAISAGIGGTEMPTWFDRLSHRDLWAVVHYVRELVRLRGTSGAANMRRGVALPEIGTPAPGNPDPSGASSRAKGSSSINSPDISERVGR